MQKLLCVLSRKSREKNELLWVMVLLGESRWMSLDFCIAADQWREIQSCNPVGNCKNISPPEVIVEVHCIDSELGVIQEGIGHCSRPSIDNIIMGRVIDVF
jgi:hypothetical protein